PLLSITFFFLLFFCTILRTLISTLFPYTTLFRSCWSFDGYREGLGHVIGTKIFDRSSPQFETINTTNANISIDEIIKIANETLRSEEHTSELQSRENLVCRLLLEKKKKKKNRK